MSEWYDVPGRDGSGSGPGSGGRGSGVDVRELLEDASWTGREGIVHPEETWTSGRRRRTRKRAGAGVIGAVVVVAVGGLVWQTGVMGGQTGPLEPTVATLPSGLTTFVLASPDAGGAVPTDLDGLVVPSAEDLAGTTWELTDQVWGSTEAASGFVGSEAETIFSFTESGAWGFIADGCGGGGRSELGLNSSGVFADGLDWGSDDQGCPEPAQTAEDFWLDVLPHGGSIHLLDDDWLLLSVDTTQAGVGQPPPVVVEDAARWFFVRDGADPGGVDTSLPERAPTNEELAGTGWSLLEWSDGAGVIDDHLDDATLLGLRWTDRAGFPDALVLDYDGCELVTVATEGVSASGATVPPEGRKPVTEGADTCAGAVDAPPALAAVFATPAQVTLVGDDLLVLRVTPPADAPATDDPATTDDPDGTDEPAPTTDGTDGQEPTGPDAGPAEPTTPTEPTEPEDPTTPTEPTQPEDPTSPAPDDPGSDDDPLPGFVLPTIVSTQGDWLGGGGELFAPTVRAGLNDGFDRIVVDLTGTGALGWRAAYTDDPTLDGSGLPSDIAGDSVLELWLSGMAYPEPGDPVYDAGLFGLDTHTLGTVIEVHRTTPFEGRLQVFIGMTGEPRPYRVLELQSPHRLVIDVQH